MPIDVTCEECFTPHRVKSEYAGKRFKCRECGATLVVPRKTAAAPSTPLPRRTAAAPQAATKKRRPTRSRRSNSSGWLSGPRVWILGGAGLLLIVVMILVPRVLAILSLPLALAGIALALWGALKCLASAFEEDVTCGLMWIFVPFYSVFYTLTRWDSIGRYFLTFVGGLLLMWAPLYGLKLMTQAQDDAFDFAPSAEITEQYDASGLDAQIEQFQQPAPPSGPAAASRVADNAAAPAVDSAPAADVIPNRPTGARAPARQGPRRYGRQPPSAEVLDGRPDPLPSPPRAAQIVIHTTSPARPGDPVWITDKGWWYPGTVTELTDHLFRVMVRFDGWEDREPVEVNTAQLRHRAAMSDDVVTYKLKLISYQGAEDKLDELVDEKFSTAYGYVAASAHVDLENYVITYQAHPGSDLDETLSATSTLTSLGIDSRGIGVVKDVTPSGELMIGQIHYKDYQGEIPLEQVADLAFRGYRQYVPDSAQVDPQAGVIRFVFDPGIVEESFFDHTPLQQLMQALSYFNFGVLTRPEATPYRKP